MAKESPAFKIKNVNLPIFIAHVLTPDLDLFKRQMAAQLAQAPTFFASTPMALGLGAIAEDGTIPDFADLTAFMRSLGTQLIGVVGGSEAQRQAASQAGLGLFPDTGPRPRLASAEPAALEPAAPAPETGTAQQVAHNESLPLPFPDLPLEPAKPETADPGPEAQAGTVRTTLVIDKPIRAGQRVYAADANLIVLAIVNAGAELIADGDIHVYAPLRGRALAGARGNAGARIFTLSLEAELVSIAGVFQVFEHGIPDAVRAKPAQVFLEGEQVVLRPLPPMR
jgi:septum site-determining protein MinC